MTDMTHTDSPILTGIHIPHKLITHLAHKHMRSIERFRKYWCGNSWCANEFENLHSMHSKHCLLSLLYIKFQLSRKRNKKKRKRKPGMNFKALDRTLVKIFSQSTQHLQLHNTSIPQHYTRTSMHTRLHKIYGELHKAENKVFEGEHPFLTCTQRK